LEALHGRTALITGGAAGLGLSFARSFAAEGMRLALVDIDEPGLESAKTELSKTTDVETYAASVADRAAFARVADAAEDALGPVALLINNAAAGAELPPEQMTYDAWDLNLGVTLGGTVNGIQTLLPRMLRRGEPGHVINVASQAGLVASHGGRMYMYTMAKFGVVGLSEALRELLRDRNVGVTLVCPGYTATGVPERELVRLPTRHLPPEVEASERVRLEAMAERMHKYGQPADELTGQAVAAVKAGQFYLHGANRSDDVIARMNEVVASMPPVNDRDRALEEFLHH
jgi:NAD(P)-dependent dehydrogenase (short-subunit alcohol dehydrogenase family)